MILLAPGSLSFPSEYSSLAEDLASHGFVVVGDVPDRLRCCDSLSGRDVTRRIGIEISSRSGQAI